MIQRSIEFPGSIRGPWRTFVHESDADGNGIIHYDKLIPRDEDSELMLSQRTLTDLYNERPMWLSLAQAELDSAVFSSYGWDTGMSDEEILASLLELNENGD